MPVVGGRGGSLRVESGANRGRGQCQTIEYLARAGFVTASLFGVCSGP